MNYEHVNFGGDEPARILGLEAIDPFVQKPAPVQHSPTKWTSTDKKTVGENRKVWTNPIGSMYGIFTKKNT